MSASGGLSAATTELAAFPTAELLLFITEADKLLAAAVASQKVRMSTPGFIPPFAAALSATESLFLRTRLLGKRFTAVFTNIAACWLCFTGFDMVAPTE